MDVSEVKWRKSSRSSEQGDACVEIALVSRIVAVRDSKDPGGPRVFVSRGEFRRLAEAIKGL
ncbi:DUF397 domain-containing protein [Actinomadura sp. 7K534]|uniref:DUF397 domain-containing protein n=1 Tax=Actinomadura sp. 7K534 TaxID=2530366 RepID=UPI00105219D5|nr:DUF397 domain-containing protein [Actinomadura sp. 7K534]TDB92831.1 DUF397 domain-containing protein [Actinomadura sp. 7K534]